VDQDGGVLHTNISWCNHANNPSGTFEKYLANSANLLYLVYKNVALAKDGNGAPFWLVTELSRVMPNIICTRETNVTALKFKV